ncbi:FAD-dependent oxidoreductase [Acinetobacter qingfengensis]|uniref:Pyridine nucleotide-disulfide oxidoreductase n=1 Tax=Acinetobacter qingfengensis TaxID=1262585 RepID=A0A1E7RCD2_9GAMM|nr:FAD-dependent oxidoreductase [Acinetobacter qingfengensis]KAA8734973.1 FAD-dependent oxidoreductase [Acinetobacter qingfengensis]OEY97060.1 pyridine nucleotide-disulfide oxidoreductase [Acinetobacter qingfengensis]
MHPIIIIGSGMAGYALAREFRKLHPEHNLIMITADDGVNYSKPMLSNALAGNRSAAQIAMADAEKMAAQLNIEILSHTWVKEIDAAQHLLTLSENKQLNYSQLILAVGANPVRLAISGDGADDIYVVNNLNDYHKFRNHIDQETQHRVLILGAGLIGCEFANDLTSKQHQVTVVDLAPQPLGRLLPEHIAQRFRHNLEEVGIQFILQTTVEKVNKIDQHYEVTLSSGQRLIADVVLSAIGLQPNIELAKQAGIKVSRGILTNTRLATNLQDIYAIGDCAEVNGILLPFVMPLMQQARALAKSLAGQQTTVHYPAMPVAVKTPAAPLTVLAAPQEIDINWQSEELDDGMIAKAFDLQGALRGFVLLGATAAKQRLTLTKQVPDLIALQS